MEFWFSGELDSKICEDYAVVRKEIEKRLNARCGSRNYGEGVIKIAIVPMILGPEFSDPDRTERRLWKRKEKLADYRTTIDFHRFKAADVVGRKRLLLESTIAAIEDLHRKAGAELKGEELVSDIQEEFAVELRLGQSGG
jgi:hypothetical protein